MEKFNLMTFLEKRRKKIKKKSKNTPKEIQFSINFPFSNYQIFRNDEKLIIFQPLANNFKIFFSIYLID